MKKLFNIFLALSLMAAVVPAQAMQVTQPVVYPVMHQPTPIQKVAYLACVAAVIAATIGAAAGTSAVLEYALGHETAKVVAVLGTVYLGYQLLG